MSTFVSVTKPIAAFVQTLACLGISTYKDMTPHQRDLYTKTVNILKNSLEILFEQLSPSEDTEFNSLSNILSEYVDVFTEEQYKKYSRSDVEDLSDEEYEKYVKNFLFFRPYPVLNLPVIPDEEIAAYMQLDESIKMHILPVLLQTMVYAELAHIDNFMELPASIPTIGESLDYYVKENKVYINYLKWLALKNAGYVTRLAREDLDEETRADYISKLEASQIRLSYDQIPTNLRVWNKLDFLGRVEGICLTGSSICPTYNRSWFPDTSTKEVEGKVELLLTDVLNGEMSWVDYRDSLPDLDIPVEPDYDLESKVLEIREYLGGKWEVEKTERSTGDIYTLRKVDMSNRGRDRKWILANKDVRNIEIYQIPRWKIQMHHISAVRAYLCYEEGEMVMYADPGYLYTLGTDRNVALFYIATKKCSGIDVIKKYMDRGINFSSSIEDIVYRHAAEMTHREKKLNNELSRLSLIPPVPSISSSSNAPTPY